MELSANVSIFRRRRRNESIKLHVAKVMPIESAVKARAFGDAINLPLYGAGVGVDKDRNLKNHLSN